LEGLKIGGLEDEAQETPVIGFIDADNSNLSSIVTSILNDYADVVFNSSNIDDKQEGLETIKQEDGAVLFIIPQNFTTNILNETPGEIEIYWIMKGAGITDAISSGAVEQLIYTINTNLSREIIQDNSSVNATLALNPTVRNEITYFRV